MFCVFTKTNLDHVCGYNENGPPFLSLRIPMPIEGQYIVKMFQTSNSRLGYAITCFEAAIEIIKSGELKRDYEREQLLAETALSSSRSNNPLHNLQGKHSRNFSRSKNSQQNGGNSRNSNSKSTSSDTWSSSSLQPLGSPSDERDSGVASDDVILTSNIDDVESNLQTSSIDDCDTIKTPSTEDNQISRQFSDPDIGQIGEVLTNGYHNSEGKAAENEGKQSVFDEDSISLTLSVSSSINRLFKVCICGRTLKGTQVLE